MKKNYVPLSPAFFRSVLKEQIARTRREGKESAKFIRELAAEQGIHFPKRRRKNMVTNTIGDFLDVMNRVEAVKAMLGAEVRFRRHFWYSCINIGWSLAPDGSDLLERLQTRRSEFLTARAQRDFLELKVWLST